MESILQGKVALVTGAASGIGRAVAIAFAREGAKVVVSDIDAAAGKAVLRRIDRQQGVDPGCGQQRSGSFQATSGSTSNW